MRSNPDRSRILGFSPFPNSPPALIFEDRGLLNITLRVPTSQVWENDLLRQLYCRAWFSASDAGVTTLKLELEEFVDIVGRFDGGVEELQVADPDPCSLCRFYSRRGTCDRDWLAKYMRSGVPSSCPRRPAAEILRALEGETILSLDEIAARLGISRRRALLALARLRRQGRVKKVRGRKRVWRYTGAT